MELYVDKVKKLRKQKKITYKKLSSLIGKSLRTVSSWETCKRIPTESDIRTLAQILNVNPSDISDLKNFDFEDTLYYFDQLNNIEKIQRSIKSHLSIEEKGWISGLISHIDLLSTELNTLKSEKENLLSIVNSLNSFIYKKDSNLNFTFINLSFAVFMKQPPEAIIGFKNKSIFNAQEVDLLKALESEALRGHNISNVEITIPASNKTKKGLFSASPVITIDGIIIGIIVRIEDITDIIAVKEQLQLVENAVNESHEALLIKKLTPLPYFSFISKSFSQITGYSTEVAYKNTSFYKTIIHEDDKERVSKFNFDTKHSSIDYRIITKNNEEKYISESRKIIPNMQIEFGVLTDITEQKKNSFIADLLKAGLDEIEDSVWMHTISPVFQYYYVNKALLRIYGYEQDEFLKDTSIWETAIHPDERDHVINHYKLIGEVPESVQYRIISTDGSVHYLDEKVMFMYFGGHKYCIGVQRILKTIPLVISN